MFDYRSAALEVLKTEIAALEQLDQYLNQDFIKACELILANKDGKVVVMGMGKSGHIGNKIAATLASTGTSSFFVHPGEAAHGDLGMIEPGDIVLAISNSGESGEILGLFPVLKRLNIKIISMTGKPKSNMAKLADIHLQITVPKEACPIQLAPTSSTTATLVMGDALAMALMQARGFTAEDFAYRIQVVRWEENCCLSCLISCIRARTYRLSPQTQLFVMRCSKSAKKGLE